ncbi:capsular biosynthesis protein [Dehalococcoidia bacterium]|nr:capsular biosynthesis protein [Dehalococcoidia bacterium]
MPSISNMLNRVGLRPYALKARDYLKHPGRVASYDLAIFRDLHRFRRTHAPLLVGSSNSKPQNKSVLIPSLSPLVYRIKLEILLGRALYLRGYKPYFLTYRSAPIPNYPSQYFRSAGFGQTLFYEDYFPKGDSTRQEISQFCTQVLTPSLEPGRLQGLSYRSVDIGEHLLASMSRTLHMGRIDLGQTKASAFAHNVLPELLSNVHAAERLLDTLSPDIVMFNDTSYTHYGPIHDLCLERNINAFQFNYGAEDNSLILKRSTTETRRTHPNSLSDDTWNMARTMSWTDTKNDALTEHFKDRYQGRWYMSQRNQHKKSIKSRDTVRRSLGIDPNKKTVVLFSHILWDANLFYGEDLFEDFGDWFVETLRSAYANPSVNWIVKLHPGNIWKQIQEGWADDQSELSLIQSRLGPLPRHITIVPSDTDLNTFSFFEIADAAITVRGTTGIELACHGVPVLTAGTGRYSGRGFTVESASKEEYLSRLLTINQIQPLSQAEINLARRYAYTLFVLRPWRFRALKSSFKAVEQGNHPLAWNLEADCSWANDLSKAPDLESLLDWIQHKERIDYTTATDE